MEPLAPPQQQPSVQPSNTQPMSPPGGEQPQLVYMARPVTPPKPELTAEERARHQNSKQLYPELHISESEYIISAVRRHPIGLLSIWLVVLLVVVLCLVGLPLYADNLQLIAKSLAVPVHTLPSVAVAAIPVLALAGLVLLGGLVATYVYLQNKFFLTNESVIQHIQTSLFSRKEQTISLNNIEDASYRQHGILQTLLNYGNIRLSTQGEETTYRFSYVANPKRQIALLNDAVEAFKMGRPPEDND